MSDKVYTSNFTGSQIDEAVDKVINGDIEGSNIKEGSIHLSALADDAKNIPNLGIVIRSLNFTLSEEETERTLKVLHLYKGNLIKISFSYDDGELIIDGDHIFFIDNSLDSYNDFILNCLDLNMYIGVSTEGLSTYRTIIEEISHPTPDWNAQHGEAGYIKNRTHYYGNTVKFKYNEYDDLYETDYVPSDEGPIYIEDVHDWNKKYEIPSIETSEDGRSGYDWSNALTIKFWDTSEEYYGEFRVGYTIDNSKVVAIYNENEADVDYDSRIKAMNIFNVVRIESEFIPDTVIKTIPQTLSDADKNQTLANLGIDPVQLKYLMSPVVLKEGDSIPEDLYDADNDNLKFKPKEYGVVYPFVKIRHYNRILDLYYQTGAVGSDWVILNGHKEFNDGMYQLQQFKIFIKNGIIDISSALESCYV